MTFSLASLCNPDAFKRENLNTSLQSSRDSKACYYKITVYGPVTVIGTLRSDDGGCLRRRAEVENIFLHISGSRRVRFRVVAVLSATSKRSVSRFV